MTKRRTNFKEQWLGFKVEVKDKDKVLTDPYIEQSAVEIIKKSDFKGEITKVLSGDKGQPLLCVGFKNDLGWVTLVFKNDEINWKGRG